MILWILRINFMCNTISTFLKIILYTMSIRFYNDIIDINIQYIINIMNINNIINMIYYKYYIL